VIFGLVILQFSQSVHIIQEARWPPDEWPPRNNLKKEIIHIHICAYARMNMLMEYVYAPTDIIQQVAIIKSKCASEKSIKLVYTV